MQDYIRRTLQSAVYELAHETPLEPMPRLSERLGRDVLLKREDLQAMFSFKIRGAHNRLSRLDADERARGVVCASAGNHAQGVAASAQHLGIRAVVVMPTTTPAIKVSAVEALGGEVVLHGDGFDDSQEHARRIEADQGLVFIHPFDDPDVIAGQATVGMEIVRQHPGPLGAVYVPIGGGGLAAGIATFVKFLRPEVKVYGVEPVDAASMSAALAAGEPATLDRVGLFVDGVAVRRVGDETFRICSELLDGIVVVSVDEVCAAIKDIFDDTRSIAEPSGALALAGLRRHLEDGEAPDGPLIAVNSGANTNFDRLRHVAERAELGEGAEAIYAVQIPEVPGSYRRFVRLLGGRQITEFNYRYASSDRATVFVGVQLRGGQAERHQIVEDLTAARLPVLDLTDNELAKLHIRHMVGGRAEGVGDELLYRFEFPERPGALLGFLDSLQMDWNISLFHYRNHGADHGRVLVGVQVPEGDRDRFEETIGRLGYPYWDENDNAAYHLFLDGT